MWKPLKSWMVHSDPIIEWYYTLRAHKIKIRRKSNKPYKRRNHWDWWWNKSELLWNVMANILHSCQVHQAAKTAVYLVGGSPYLKWHPVHDHKEHAHQVTALSSCMSLLCTILHYWITAQWLWCECMFQGGTAIWRSTIALCSTWSNLACHKITSPSSRSSNHSALTARHVYIQWWLGWSFTIAYCLSESHFQ